MPISPQDFSTSQIVQSEAGVLAFTADVLSAITNDTGHNFTQTELDSISDAVIDVFADPAQELTGENVAEFVIALSNSVIGTTNEPTIENSDTSTDAAATAEEVADQDSGQSEQEAETSEPITVPDSITIGDEPDAPTNQPRQPRESETSSPRSQEPPETIGQPEEFGQPEPIGEPEPIGQPEAVQEPPPEEPPQTTESIGADLPVSDSGSGGGTGSGSPSESRDQEQPPEAPPIEVAQEIVTDEVADVGGAGLDVESIRALGVFFIDYYFSKWAEHSPPITNRYEPHPDIPDADMIAAYRREWNRVGKAYEQQVKQIEPEQLAVRQW